MTKIEGRGPIDPLKCSCKFFLFKTSRVNKYSNLIDFADSNSCV